MNAPVDARKLAEVSLDDKYTLEKGQVFLTGTQALIRLLLLQRERDRRAGLNTAGFVSGYRGSPLGGLDQSLWRAQKHLSSHHVRFQPGVNEDLAATAIWGTQQVGMFPGARYDGVFGMWYGKGPGVDRCGDVFKHANSAGTSKHGGVLVLAGDDHTCKSSTSAHQIVTGTACHLDAHMVHDALHHMDLTGIDFVLDGGSDELKPALIEGTTTVPYQDP